MVRLRFQCKVCARNGKGGYFTIKVENKNIIPKNISCPYCGSSKVKLLG